jgi:hypothetical protein
LSTVSLGFAALNGSRGCLKHRRRVVGRNEGSCAVRL